MRSSFTFLRVRGIPIGANISWLFIVGLIVYSLTSFLFPNTYPGLSSTAYLVMGVIASVLFFASIVLHELGHAFQALKEGMKIDGITLWLFGGVARFRGMFPSAGAEFRIAIAGPIVSALIALGFVALTVLGNTFDWPEAVKGVTDYLARINGLVLGFNLVPALPLDGGRILRAWLWHRQDNFASATSSAGAAGRAFGFLLVTVGILNLLAGAGAGGLWFAFLGWFLIQAAKAESSFVLAHQAFQGRRVRDLMTPDPVRMPPSATVGRFFDEAAASGGHPVYPVADDDELLGVVTLERAASVPIVERDRTSVADIALRRSQIAVLDAHAELVDALETVETGPGRVPVLENGRLVGILSLSDMQGALRIEQARGPAPGDRARRTSLFVWAIVMVIMLLVGAYLYRPPVLVVSPGATFDVSEDIEISGIETGDIDGSYLLTSVRLERPNALQAGYAMIFSEGDVIPLSEALPRGQSEEEFSHRQRVLFRESRLLAAAAAASTMGRDAEFTGTGVIVQDVLAGSPAADEIETGDVILSVDGEDIPTAPDLRELVGSRPAGTSFELTIERGSREFTITLETERLSSIPDGSVGLGVVVATRDLDVELPFEVEFQERDVGGPSAGLVYALAIVDLLDQDDLAQGRTIGATGTIEAGGSVGSVGGVDLKAVALSEVGADLFLVPEGEVDLASVEDLEVRGVSDLAGAIDVLESSAGLGPTP